MILVVLIFNISIKHPIKDLVLRVSISNNNINSDNSISIKLHIHKSQLILLVS